MKVKELIDQLQKLDPEAVVVVAGFETQSTGRVAETDLIMQCHTIATSPNVMEGNRNVARDGVSSVWLGWSNDYRTECFINAVNDPDEFA